MPEAFSGASGSGSYITYEVPRDHSLRLDILTFTLTTGAATGVHSAQVSFYDTTLNQTTARIWDWNEAALSMTLYYTYAIGLRPFNCTVTTGMRIPNALPETILAPGTQIVLSALTDAGVTIAGDAFSAVVGYGTFIGDVVETQNDVVLVPGLLYQEAA